MSRAASTPDALRAFEARVRDSTLASGVRVVSDPVPDAASTALSIWVPAGSRDEPAEAAGAVHFLEHLLFRGTTRRSAHELNVAIDAVGGELNAFTSKETTAFFARVPAPHGDLAVELLCELVLDPALDADDVDSEREVILEELAMVNDTPDELAASLLDEALFAGHALGWEVLGRPETLDAMGIDDLRGMHERWYRHGRLVIAAAGALDHEQLVQAVEARLGDRHHSRPARSAPGERTEARIDAERDCEQIQVAMGWRGLPQADADRWALAVLLHAFGDGPSSRLYREVRDERGLVYSIGTNAAAYSDAGAVQLSFGATVRHLEEARAVVDAELDALRRGGISDEELRIAVGYLQGSLMLSIEDAGSRMGRLGASVSGIGRVESPCEAFAGYGGVTGDDVRRVAERIFGAPASIVTVGPS